MDRYVLATGGEAVYRLGLVEEVHGPDTQAFLRRSGIQAGMSVADIGCGVGAVSRWMARQVGPSGLVTGVDVSDAQVAQARSLTTRAGMANVIYRAASCYQTGLKRASCDLVFSRFMLMHVQRPVDALEEMVSLLAPGGILAVEDGDFSSPFCWPESAAYNRCFELYRRAGERAGADFHMGRSLYRLVCELGLHGASASLAQPALVHGEAKRLPEWTLEEMAEDAIRHGDASREEIESILEEMQRLAADPKVIFGMARMTQVSARA